MAWLHLQNWGLGPVVLIGLLAARLNRLQGCRLQRPCDVVQDLRFGDNDVVQAAAILPHHHLHAYAARLVVSPCIIFSSSRRPLEFHERAGEEASGLWEGGR